MSGNNYDPSAPPKPVAPAPVPTPVVPPPPAPGPATPPAPYDVAKIRNAITIIVGFADTARHLIPGEVDDKIIAVAKEFALQPWFAEALAALLTLTQSQRTAVLQAMAPSLGGAFACLPPALEGEAQ